MWYELSQHYLQQHCGRPGAWKRQRVPKGSWSKSAAGLLLSRPAHVTAWHQIGSQGHPEPTAREIKIMRCPTANLQYMLYFILVRFNMSDLYLSHLHPLSQPWEQSVPQMSREVCAETFVLCIRLPVMLQPIRNELGIEWLRLFLPSSGSKVLDLLLLTPLFFYTPSQSSLHQIRHDWSHSEAHRSWWWSHPLVGLDHLGGGEITESNGFW